MMHTEESNGFSVVSYVGDGAVLLAFDVDPQRIQIDRLAGFSIWCRTPKESVFASAKKAAKQAKPAKKAAKQAKQAKEPKQGKGKKETKPEKEEEHHHFKL
jgi:ribosomal protein L12E/L44/L45/RPP1/RPP2